MADRALRVSFLSRDGDISIRTATLVKKRAPASVSTEGEDPGTGFWLELRDGETVLYRRLVSAQFEREVEVFGGGSDEPFKRVQLSRPSEIDLAVPLPATGDARHLRLVLTERQARAEGPSPSPTSAARSDERIDADSRAERQHVDVALGDLVDMH